MYPLSIFKASIIVCVCDNRSCVALYMYQPFTVLIKHTTQQNSRIDTFYPFIACIAFLHLFGREWDSPQLFFVLNLIHHNSNSSCKVSIVNRPSLSAHRQLHIQCFIWEWVHLDFPPQDQVSPLNLYWFCNTLCITSPSQWQEVHLLVISKVMIMFEILVRFHCAITCLA